MFLVVPNQAKSPELKLCLSSVYSPEEFVLKHQQISRLLQRQFAQSKMI